MKRRDFIYLSGAAVGGLFLPSLSVGATDQPTAEKLASLPADKKKQWADLALTVARSAGASYTDVRIARYFNQMISTRETHVQHIFNGESFGIGIRVLVEGCWGFAATNTFTDEQIIKTTQQAVAIAKVNAKLLEERVELAPQAGYGEVFWQTPIERNAFEVPLEEKIDLLLSVNDAALAAGVRFVNSSLSLVNEQKYFASSEGTYADQQVHRLWPNFTVTKVGKGGFESRNALSAPIGMGFEYLTPKAEEKITGGPVTLYKNRYDMLEDVKEASRHVEEKLNSKPVVPGKYDLVLDPSHLFLTIHESVGHPTELDRVLGYEANYAGTSFLTLDKWESGSFNFGSPLVNIRADKTEKNALATVGYDDEGVKCGEWKIIDKGILVNYQTTRDQAHILGLDASQGCSYADNWESIPFQRMPNVSLLPGKEALTAAEMVKDVEKGIYMFGRNSYSIDQQRYNFQFSAQLAYEIKNGEIVGLLKDAAYQSNTQEFWNSCVSLCDSSDYRLGGTFADGKGQPSQISAVSHGCPTTRFNGINVINTGSKLG